MKKIYELEENEINHYMNNNLQIDKIKKDKFGEVFTPIELTNELLDNFPNSVWSNPKLLWLDPSAGIGHLLVVVYLRLMKGLHKWEPNEKKRSNHIIKNMLYMVEINRNNCRKLNKLFGQDCNIICNDFLLDHKYDNILFDCIISNPPFQDDYGLTNGKRVIGGKSKLYEKIFIKCFSMLNSGGYIAFITPDNILSGNTTKAYPVFLENYVKFVSLDNIQRRFFPSVQQHMCYFIIEKEGKKKNTILINNNGDKLTINIKDRVLNPVRNWSIKTDKLIDTYLSDTKNHVVYNRGKNLDAYKGTKYTLIYTPDKMLHTNNEKLAVGYGIPKIVIFGISTKLDFKDDYAGEYGVGPNTFYIPIKNASEGKRISSFLKSDIYSLLVESTKTTRQFMKIALLEYLNIDKIVRKPGTKKIRKYKNKTRKL